MSHRLPLVSFRLVAAAFVVALLPSFALAQEVPEARRPTIAVWDFTLSRMDEADGSAVTNRLRSELVNSRRFRVMTRDQIQTLLGEQALGQTLVDAKEAIRAGKLKGVQFVVTGTLINIRGAYQVTAEMINGETAEIIQSITPRTYRGGFLDFLDEEVPNLADRLMGAAGGKLAVLPENPPPTPKVQAPAPPPPRREAPPKPARTMGGPDFAFNFMVGYASYGGSVEGFGYASSGLNLGLDFQIPFGSNLSVNVIYMLSFEGYSGDLGSGDESGGASHQILAGQVRLWLGPLFVGGHAGYYSEGLVSNDFAGLSSSGFGFGGVAGISLGGVMLTGQLDLAYLSADDGSAVDLFGLYVNLEIPF